MTTYPYTGRDLFEKPEFYHYAQCDNPEYLDAWRNEREQVLTRIGQRSTDVPLENLCSEACESGTVANRLTSLVRELQEGVTDEASIDILGQLVHKFEVSRCLYRRYASDWRRLEGEPPATLGTYLLFGLALSMACQRSVPDLQKVSTLIKLCDVLASKDVETYDVTQSGALRTLLLAERQIVLELACAR